MFREGANYVSLMINGYPVDVGQITIDTDYLHKLALSMVLNEKTYGIILEWCYHISYTDFTSQF